MDTSPSSIIRFCYDNFMDHLDPNEGINLITLAESISQHFNITNKRATDLAYMFDELLDVND